MPSLFKTKREALFFMGGVAVAMMILCVNYWYSFIQQPSHGVSYGVKSDKGGDKSIAIPMDAFPEAPWRTEQTLAVRTVTSTPFARFEIHKVKTESGAIVNDWLWTDERSHINMLVHLKAEDKFLLFHQRKYGLEKPYYAAVGGLFNAGETSTVCARRELLEETGLEAEELVDLGRYRVQVNRGGGILYAFYAKNAVPSKHRKASDDYESQEKRLLTREELIKVALAGEIGEAQWLATIALGLVYEDHKELYTKKPIST